MFQNLNNEGLEQQEDRLGGSGPLDTNIYTGTIKQFYGIKSDAGAMGVVFILDVDGREYRENIYVTNRKGENFYTKDGKKYQLPGFITANDIALCANGQQLNELEWEEKQVKQWSDGKEVLKSAQVAVDLLGKTVTVAIVNTLKNKQEKNNKGDYVDVAGERAENNIEKVFDSESKRTVREAIDGKEEAVFHDEWKKKNEGVQRDKRSIKDGGAAGSAGAPPKAGAATSAPSSTGGKSLFNKK
ncbi:ssDNA binding protein [Xanthomonas phage RiverRider]|uniref:SsDNA binding protein n=1 Tax=Xanthomonas phage RiverRider TaxID=2108116 RepID=A0A2P1JUW8_9CAUD|nr:single strand DNA binding protein [Xanthomonas phage RiverRider]AVO23148.1 ssDNA binding protein [Xanthomonas phage RiverRider]